MFRVHQHFEILDGFSGPGEHHYHVVQQALELPLWTVRVLPVAEPSVDPDLRVWNRYLATQTEMILQVVNDPQSERVRLHVLLPDYMTQDNSLTLTRCLSIWEGRAVNDVNYPQDVHHLVWMFETDLGWFVDPVCGVQGLDDATKHLVRWKDREDEWDKKGRRKGPRSASKKK